MAEANQNGEFHRFAWDGLSFDVPANWDLSEYHFGKQLSEVKMEDEVGLRLELRWTRARKRLDEERVRNRYEKGSHGLTDMAEERRPITTLGRGWTAFLYTMADRQVLITAFWLSPDAHTFCFFCLHFEGIGKRKPVRIMEALAASLAVETGPSVAWSVYDISFRLNRDLRLVGTSFQAGRKLMVFQWRLRRLYVWHFSLADMLLKEQTLAAWGAGFLNGYKEIRGPRFVPAGDTRIRARRCLVHPLGHHDEIARLCFRYRVAARHDPECNAVRLSVFNYRHAADLERLAYFCDSTQLDFSPVHGWST